MTSTSFLEDALFEHRFWLQILGDHSRFILNTLSPNERDKIKTSRQFIAIFDELLEESRRELSENQLEDLTVRAQARAMEIREFKLNLIRDHILGMITIELPPTFINHMVNEVEEYLYNIYLILNKQAPYMNPLHDHTLWLPDASGHAGAIYCGLDSTERDLRNKSKEYMMTFEDLYIKADEFNGYLRTGVNEFPALARLNSLVEDNILLFMSFLKEIEEMRISKRALGTLMPLMADHMFREECYYLTQLSMKTNVSKPPCDPTAPRLEV